MKSYTPEGQVRSVTQVVEKGPPERVRTWTYEYDPDGNLTTVIDPLGYVFTTDYDAQGRIRLTRDAEGHETTYTYTPDGRVQTITDAQGYVTHYIYTTGRCARGGTLTPHLTAIIDANGHCTSFYYDGLGRLGRVVNPLGQERQYLYDFQGRLGKYINGRGQWVIYQYDVSDRLISKTLYNADGSVQDWVNITYDGLGRIVAGENSASRLEWEQWDIYESHQRERIMDKGHQPSSMWAHAQYYQWDDRVRSQLFVEGNLLMDIWMNYDGLMRKVYESLSGSLSGVGYRNVWDAEFNLAGEMTRRKIHNWGGTGGEGRFTETWFYDGAGRLTEKGLYKADGWGNPVGALRIWRYPMYDGIGNILQKVTESYDPPGTLKESYTSNYGYDATYQLLSANYSGTVPPNLGNEWYQYDPVGNRLASYLSSFYTHNEANELVEDATWTYRYDADGNMIERTCKTPVVGAKSSVSHEDYGDTESAYLTQPDSHLLLWSTEQGDISEGKVPYTRAGKGEGPFSFSGLNSLQTSRANVDKASMPSDSRTSAGSLSCTPGERWVFAYNAENTLHAVYQYIGTQLIKEIHYEYDALGRRIEKRVIDAQAGTMTITQFVYRDEDLAVEFTVDPLTGTRTLKNLYAHGTLGVDDPIAVYSCEPTCPTGSWLTYAKDHLNSLERLYNPANIPLNSISYSSFGIPNFSGPSGQNYSFTGREWDKELSLYYYRARFYDPKIGRFLRKDPIRDWYEYYYASQNPLRFDDPFGLQSYVPNIDETCKDVCTPEQWKKLVNAWNKACTDGPANLENQGYRAIAFCIREQCAKKQQPKIECKWEWYKWHGLCVKADAFVDPEEFVKDKKLPIHICRSFFEYDGSYFDCSRANALVHEMFHRCETIRRGVLHDISDVKCTSYKIGNKAMNNQCNRSCQSK